ncbi:rCG62912, isoform CRA_b [Rattus norvegicus]|uniref:RCG62912, isoform CRA_b n=1 Tax=Rattus norvegicus TaxID=10116 RepID=A6J2W1_RAT|nr:rCG62912, isoform CRA_b [Rattus norvegicus]
MKAFIENFFSQLRPPIYRRAGTSMGFLLYLHQHSGY